MIVLNNRLQKITFCFRGFMKYRRQKVIYQPVDERIKGWSEITDYSAVRSNIREQAARFAQYSLLIRSAIVSDSLHVQRIESEQ